MKHIIYTAFILLLASACSKPAPSPEAETEQYGRYIFFSQQVGTKADLIESAAAMDQFGVVGFKYEGTWADKKASLKPKVFYDNNGNLVNTETLTCNDDGTADYAPLQGWSSFKNYAFFAYYPIDQAVTLVNDDGTPYTAGVPAIKYTMNPDALKASMVDVMTAPAHTDLYWRSDADYSKGKDGYTNGEVTFSFAHRLSSLGVKVMNSSAGEVVLNSVSLKLENIMYQTIIIPLYGDNNPTRTEFTSPHTEEMALAGVAGTSILKNKDDEISDKLIFIPQETPISVQVTVGYTRKSVGDDHYSYEEYTETRTLPAQTTELEEGKKHLISLKFTDSTVEVKGIASTGWKEPIEVEDTFN